MDLFTIVGASLRRWYVTLPVLLVALVGAGFAYRSVAPLYTSSVSVAVLPSTPTPAAPGEEETPAGENPYSGSGGARFAAAVLARNINTGTYRDSVGLGGRSDVTFSAEASSQQPMIRIDATGPSAKSVLDTLDRVAGQAGVVLNQFQVSAGASKETLYRLAVAVPADTVSDITPSRWRNAGAIIAAGLVVAASLATALDVMLRRRPGRNRAARRNPPGSDDDRRGLVEPAVGQERRADGHAASDVVFPRYSPAEPTDSAAQRADAAARAEVAAQRAPVEGVDADDVAPVPVGEREPSPAPVVKRPVGATPHG